MSLADVVKTGAGLPNRYIVHGPEGCGKTSFGAYAPKPLFIQTKGETGLETLINHGRLPETPHWPESQTWDDLLGQLAALLNEPHDHKTVVVDTLNGAERMCHEHVCARDFNGDWGEHGFVGYQRGFDVSLGEWRTFLNAMDALREQRKMAILCLCHSKVGEFRNPEGSDYDRYQPDMHKKTWSLTHKWADAVLFINFETFVNEKDPKKKGKATSSQARLMYTERRAAYDAKNRMGLLEEIDMGNSGQEAWNNFITALKSGKAATNG